MSRREKTVTITQFKLIRMSRRIKQQQIADAVGCSKQFVSQLELGQRRAKPELEEAIALYLGVDRSTIFAEK